MQSTLPGQRHRPQLSTTDLLKLFPSARTILLTSGMEFISNNADLLPAKDLLASRETEPRVYLAAKTRLPLGPLGSARAYDIGGDPRVHEAAEVVLALLPQGYVHIMEDRFGPAGMWRLGGRPMCSNAAFAAMHLPGVVRVVDVMRGGARKRPRRVWKKLEARGFAAHHGGVTMHPEHVVRVGVAANTTRDRIEAIEYELHRRLSGTPFCVTMVSER